MQRRATLPIDPLGILGVVGLAVLWWLLTTFELVPRLFLPPPAEVFDFLVNNFVSSDYLENYHLGSLGLSGSLLYTIGNVLLALAISCVLGISLGLTSARVDGVRAVFDPIVLTVGTIPVLVTAPFFLIWFGTERAPQVALLTLYDTTIIYMFAQRAVANLDPIYRAAARTLGASPVRVIAQVYLAGTLPEVFGGIRIAMAGAWGLEAVAELLGAPAGIGRVIQAVASATDVPTIVATILALALVAVVFDAAFAAFFGFITRWRARAVRP
ncbi:MAG TPA: ABC transporter permease subunit [Chloroflexota bacterium]|jgi:ABC-type nitrate/sulfonate/bicarbonate transport system permease component